MRRLWQDMGDHQTATNTFLLVWLAAWVLTVSTWLYDSSGYSASMHPIATPFHFALLLAAGILAGWWRKVSEEHTGILDSIGGGAVAGVEFAIANFAVLLVFAVFQFALGHVEPVIDQPWWGNVAEAAGMGLAYCIVGLVLGAIGGFIGRIIPRSERSAAV